MLSSGNIEAFRADGFVVVKGLIPDDSCLAVLDSIDRLIALRWPRFVRSSPGSLADDVQKKVLDLAQTDRAELARLYDAIRKVAPFWEIVGSRALQAAARTLLGADALGVAFRGCGIRLDLPAEDRWRSQWHQEYHSQMSSMRALTAWFGFVPVTTAMGPVEFLRGSQAEGLLPARCGDPLNLAKDYTGTFVLPQVEDLRRRYETVAAETEAGDVVFLDFFTVHQSGYNRDEVRSRITGQVRYFDMSDDTAVAHDWRGGWQEGHDFRQAHPDRVVG